MRRCKCYNAGVNERDTFIRAIAEGWDDSTPVLVFADWAEEHGTDDPALLRWYGWHVMPALAAVPDTCKPSGDARWASARKSLRKHPLAGVLSNFVVAAFCRRPCVWDGESSENLSRKFFGNNLVA